jgi:hypothetical protein
MFCFGLYYNNINIKNRGQNMLKKISFISTNGQVIYKKEVGTLTRENITTKSIKTKGIECIGGDKYARTYKKEK